MRKQTDYDVISAEAGHWFIRQPREHVMASKRLKTNGGRAGATRTGLIGAVTVIFGNGILISPFSKATKQFLITNATPPPINGVFLLELLKSKKLQFTAENSVAVVTRLQLQYSSWTESLRPARATEISHQKTVSRGKKEEKEGRGREKQESKQVGREPTTAELGKQNIIPRLIFTTFDNILTLLSIHFIRPQLI